MQVTVTKIAMEFYGRNTELGILEDFKDFTIDYEGLTIDDIDEELNQIF